MALFLWLLRSSLSVDTIPNAGRCNFRQRFFSALPAELVRMVFPTSPGTRSARQFEGFVYVDGQLGRENQDIIRFRLSEKWKMFLNGGLVSGFGYRKGTCVNQHKRAWQVGFDRQPKAERLGELVCLDRRQGNRLMKRVRETENPIKISFSILRFRELLGYDTREKQAKIKLIFLVLYKKIVR